MRAHVPETRLRSKTAVHWPARSSAPEEWQQQIGQIEREGDVAAAADDADGNQHVGEAGDVERGPGDDDEDLFGHGGDLDQGAD